MAKMNEEELQKHTLNLYPGDYARLQSLYPDVGAGPVIRRIVREFLDRIESQQAQSNVDVEVKI